MGGPRQGCRLRQLELAKGDADKGRAAKPGKLRREESVGRRSADHTMRGGGGG